MHTVDKNCTLGMLQMCLNCCSPAKSDPLFNEYMKHEAQRYVHIKKCKPLCLLNHMRHYYEIWLISYKMQKSGTISFSHCWYADTFLFIRHTAVNQRCFYSTNQWRHRPAA